MIASEHVPKLDGKRFAWSDRLEGDPLAIGVYRLRDGGLFGESAVCENDWSVASLFETGEAGGLFV